MLTLIEKISQVVHHSVIARIWKWKILAFAN